MEKKRIELKHYVCDYTCMWNGIEDVFMQKSKETVPDWFFFCLSGIATHVYLHSKDEYMPRQLCVGDGRPKQVYQEIADIIGMNYKITDEVSYLYAWKTVKHQIDEGHPVILGPLDMYHLPYLKMYHQVHIPIHYILMVGYDDEKQCIEIYDCGREELQEVPYEELAKAWQVEKSVTGGCNGFVTFEFQEKIRSIEEIMILALHKKAESQLEKKPEFVGLSAIRKAAREFLHWEQELTPTGYRNALTHMTEFLATVPKLPNRLIPGQEGEADVPYEGNCDKMASLLAVAGERYGHAEWTKAAKAFAKSGIKYAAITDILCEYLTNQSDQRSQVPNLLNEIADLEEEAFLLCLKVKAPSDCDEVCLSKVRTEAV